MSQLSEKQAQEIVDKMMMDIPYNINIMNDNGIIVGSGKRADSSTADASALWLGGNSILQRVVSFYLTK
ncbi:sugar diacid recognition domain-containing protein [Paenibacillus puldeungensis]|uniref:Sugar diacid recognition domain-containing protein n=1 Tax=Paenibacillus puldeungensis TaxID=696536 RepID=A0ABW3RZH6_9BACL